MSGCDQWALVKAVQLLLCFGCLGFKWWTDYEASRLFFLFEKQSREWPLSTNVTINQTGSWFADVTFGAYTIICIALFIAHVVGELKTTRKTESFLLGIGGLLFIGVGMLILSSFDNVPDELIDNAVILGLLALITGALFLIDVGCLRNKQRPQKTQPAFPTHHSKPHKVMKHDLAITNGNVESSNLEITDHAKKTTTKKDVAQDKVIHELSSSMKEKKSIKKEEETKPVHAKHKMENEVQQAENVQYGRKHLENRGFPQKTNVQNYEYEKEPERRYKNKNVKITAESESESDEEQLDKVGKRRIDNTDEGYAKIDKKKTQIIQTVESYGVRDTGTSTDEDVVDYVVLQSPKVTSSGLNGQRINNNAQNGSRINGSRINVVNESRTNDENSSRINAGNGTKTNSEDSSRINNDVNRSRSTESKNGSRGNDLNRSRTDNLNSPSSSISRSFEEKETIRISSTSYLLSEKGLKIMPTTSSSRIENLSTSTVKNSNDIVQNSKIANGKSFSSPTTVANGKVMNHKINIAPQPPTTPRDPGYVLHTASNWPNSTPICQDSQPDNKLNNSRNNHIVHSDV